VEVEAGLPPKENGGAAGRGLSVFLINYQEFIAYDNLLRPFTADRGERAAIKTECLTGGCWATPIFSYHAQAPVLFRPYRQNHLFCACP
jgi:hypothetical protein